MRLVPASFILLLHCSTGAWAQHKPKAPIAPEEPFAADSTKSAIVAGIFAIIVAIIYTTCGKDKSEAGVATLSPVTIVTPTTQPAPAPLKTIREKIETEKPFHAILNEPGCDQNNMGTLRCGFNYTVTYSKSEKSWTVRGIVYPTEKIATHTDMTGDIDNNVLALWGGRFRFDKDGDIIDPNSNKIVGHLSFDN
jgi:hypothetical protein